MKRSGFSRLRVQNFQSIENADVPLGPLTIIIGDNFAGKSALLRAIKSACFNETGTADIRKGASKSVITLTLSEGDRDTHEVTWLKRREGGATYRLAEVDANGEAHRDDAVLFSKLGASVPPEIAKALNIAQIVVDKTLTLTPQIHEQGDYSFLLDRSEGQAARALAKMTKLDVVVEAQGLIRIDLRHARGELTTVTSLIEGLEKQEREFEGLDEEVHLLENVSGFIRLAEAKMAGIAREKTLLTQYIIAHRMLEDAGTLPPEATMTRLATEFNRIREQRRVLAAYDVAVAEFAAVADKPIPTIPDFSARVVRILGQKEAFRNLVQADAALVAALEEEEQVDKVYAMLVEEWNALGVCPWCQQPLPKMEAEER